ncbi:hypothetical protein [Flavilitoribacter nigricans]|uniref:Uncharacterized protein n=1 Tax=Flavilitoribacter nigricans (strain ATCC 23147 / DSM 23189 / NBRC 102662 / NCIMB 1420 / SS-2) TaxID=1122177 RepID=A0A2D0N1Z6_FLAN2|nr:hypothetical protein [Flavilitoribacter nigricans]PHN02525.1 hypothetical protein CRP01_31610 [Flavilitoribacter nigricans DSM 23189 = NBRC 102662]
MIVRADIISQPESGKYPERIFDNPNVWNSPGWSWVKFTNADGREWVGHFRGAPGRTACSVPLKETIVLTSDYVFRLSNSLEYIRKLEEKSPFLEFEWQPPYRELAVAPSGAFIFADDYQVEKMNDGLADKTVIDTPLEIENIKFTGWNGDRLAFTCDAFPDGKQQLMMELDTNTWKISSKGLVS